MLLIPVSKSFPFLLAYFSCLSWTVFILFLITWSFQLSVESFLVQLFSLLQFLLNLVKIYSFSFQTILQEKSFYLNCDSNYCVQSPLPPFLNPIFSSKSNTHNLNMFLKFWLSNYEIHCDLISFPFWNRQLISLIQITSGILLSLVDSSITETNNMTFFSRVGYQNFLLHSLVILFLFITWDTN